MSAKRMGLNPSWVKPDDLFAVTTSTGEQYINVGYSTTNTHVSGSLARNKYYARLILDRHDLPNIPFARPKTIAEAQLFLAVHGTIVVKPTSGAGSRDIHIISTPAQLTDAMLHGYIFEKYIAGREMRYLVLGDKVIAVHHSEYGESVDEHRPLERNSLAETDWDAILVRTALRVTTVLGLQFAAVDFIIDASGTAHILEVNSVPGLKWFHAPSKGPKVDVATLFLQSMLANA